MNWFVTNKHKSTFNKVTSLLTFVTFTLLVLVVILYFYMKYQEKKIYDISNKIYEKEIKSLVKLNSDNLTSLAVEITYWDEFVKFIDTKDLDWFNVSIANIINNYNVQYVGVFNLNNELIAKASSPKIKSINFIPKEYFKLLNSKKIDKFYLEIPEGIIEVYATTIHPSNDPFKNKTKPAGYFFMIKLMDNDYFANFEKVTTSNIDFSDNKTNQLVIIFH